VKRLAKQTVKAAEEIASDVNGIRGATNVGVDALDAIRSTIGEIKQISRAISASIEEQTAAVREISRYTAAVAEGARDVTTAIGAVRQGAPETSAGALQSLGAANKLRCGLIGCVKRCAHLSRKSAPHNIKVETSVHGMAA
jgi:methyl-accepting chemotaxis protein